jgi:hypothetical protein
MIAYTVSSEVILDFVDWEPTLGYWEFWPWIQNVMYKEYNKS